MSKVQLLNAEFLKDTSLWFKLLILLLKYIDTEVVLGILGPCTIQTDALMYCNPLILMYCNPLILL